jgi:putative hydrolase of the HAD superfamily
MPTKRSTIQTLLIDADDTLWENNIYFEQAIEAFIDYLDHSSLSREQVRAVLDEIELANAGVHGYGSKIFSTSLCQCYEHLAERDIGDDDLATVLGFGDQILQQDIVLLPGVAETLVELSKRHQLVLLTKGSDEEQRMKIDRSGIDMHFIDAIVVPEKSETVYRETITSLSCRAESTWMIGNSPKSDINPALAAGLNAVFIPHDWTWSLEHQELQTGPGRFIQLARFAELLHHF